MAEQIASLRHVREPTDKGADQLDGVVEPLDAKIERAQGEDDPRRPGLPRQALELGDRLRKSPLRLTEATHGKPDRRAVGTHGLRTSQELIGRTWLIPEH